jgi:hypothetical protein
MDFSHEYKILSQVLLMMFWLLVKLNLKLCSGKSEYMYYLYIISLREIPGPFILISDNT